MKYNQFIFKNYSFDREQKLLELHYALDDQIQFTEVFRFQFDYVNYDLDLLDRVLEGLFLIAGVSYYKTYLPAEIVIERGRIDQVMADFLGKTYQMGLSEFFYVNQLDPSKVVKFPTTTDKVAPVETIAKEGILVGMGGGKDSLAAIELLRDQPKVATWGVDHGNLLDPLNERIGLPHFKVTRQWDKQLLELNQQGAYNGHVPVSAIWAAVGAVTAVLSGYHDVIVANESSANEPTLYYKGQPVNHQYSKSLEFEVDYQQYLEHTVGYAIRYYSFVRPLSDIRVVEIFAKVGFDKYQGTFSSCNRIFGAGNNHIFWCGICPKCAFVFLALTPFVEREKLEALFDGRNLLLDPTLEKTYRSLLGIEGDKPLECVGEIKESRTAMRLAQKQYPELNKYKFDIPSDYDYRTLAKHSMPTELYLVLLNKISDLKL